MPQSGDLRADIVRITIFFVKVQYDADKDVINLKKHGVSLQAAENFDMITALLEVDDREDYGELRYNAIGFLSAALYSLTFTVRDEEIRPISLRCATKIERNRYAENV